MEASVCYDDGVAPVAKFTEKQIHIIVRQSQSLLRDVCVCVWVCIIMRIRMCVLWVGGSDMRAHHLLEKTIICESGTSCFCLLCQVPITSSLHHWYVSVCVCVCGGVCVCVCVCELTHIDGPPRSISRGEV